MTGYLLSVLGGSLIVLGLGAIIVRLDALSGYVPTETNPQEPMT